MILGVSGSASLPEAPSPLNEQERLFALESIVIGTMQVHLKDILLVPSLEDFYALYAGEFPRRVQSCLA